MFPHLIDLPLVPPAERHPPACCVTHERDERDEFGVFEPSTPKTHTVFVILTVRHIGDGGSMLQMWCVFAEWRRRERRQGGGALVARESTFLSAVVENMNLYGTHDVGP